jgi:hypothetical protein
LIHAPRLPAVAALLLFALAACSGEEKLQALCADDAECVADHQNNPNWYCDKVGGRCACTSDAACTGPAEHCEPLAGGGDGLCHPNRSCEWNHDCPGGYCDTTSGICRSSGCSMDLHCPFGQVCDGSNHVCVSGCRSHGDCALGDVCLCTDGQGNEVGCTCDETTEAGRALCAVGSCVTGTCLDKSFCGLGEQCVSTPEAERPVCEPDDRGPFCDNCQPETGGFACGSAGPNFCLLDTSDPSGRASFCGVDCSEGGDEVCPNGFSCHDVLRLTQATCRSDLACVPTGDACGGDEECPPGSRCVIPAGMTEGRCGGKCAIGEGDESGFCTCVTDADCPQQACGSDGRCTITREFCTPGTSPDPCTGKIFCKNNGEVGYCQIGRNCAPIEGITCADVREALGR